MSKIVRPLRSGQITIPSDFREKLGITPDSLLLVDLVSGELRIRPVVAVDAISGSDWFKDLYDEFAPLRKEAQKYNEKEINTGIEKAIQAVRKKHAKRSV